MNTREALRASALLSLALAAQAPGAAASAAEPVAVPMDSPRWKVEAAESRVEEHLGRQSLLLVGGAAVLEDVELEDGVIEFDIAFGPERGFAGVAWRAREGGNNEHFYLRPHQSGKPDSIQYTPNFNGVAGWQLYHGAGYGGAVEFPFHEWIHVRVVVSGGQAEAWVDSDAPVLFMPELKHAPRPGALALLVGSFAPAHFSGFRYQVLERPALQGRAPEPGPAPEGAVTRWSVSSAFDGARLEGRFSLEASDTAGLDWRPLEAEASGITNLARVQGVAKGADTTFVRLRVSSDREQTQLLRFGYSDRVRVYLGGRLLYSGDNGYQSRDFRYLGTIGLFDSVPLRLAAGENELLFAVSESFGGWGILAALPPGAGLQTRP